MLSKNVVLLTVFSVGQKGFLKWNMSCFFSSSFSSAAILHDVCIPCFQRFAEINQRVKEPWDLYLLSVFGVPLAKTMSPFLAWSVKASLDRNKQCCLLSHVTVLDGHAHIYMYRPTQAWTGIKEGPGFFVWLPLNCVPISKPQQGLVTEKWGM